MKTTEQDIKNLKNSLKLAETAKIQAETQKVAAEEQLKTITEQMATLGVTPDNIVETITSLSNEVDTTVAKLKELIPNV